MNRLTRGLASVLAVAILGLTASAKAQTQRAFMPENINRVSDGRDGMPAGTVQPSNYVPMNNWDAPKTFKSRVLGDGQKAATDATSVFRPLPLCRLMDTRVGQPSALGVNGGVLLANNGRIITPAGACGLPTGSVAALSLSFATQNTTVNNGGYLTFIPTPASPVAGSNMVFNPGEQWASTTANVGTAGNASFVAFVANSTVHLIIDINGYYQTLGNLDSNDQLDIFGATAGDLFELNNTSASGTALGVNAGATGGKAITVYSGAVRVAGAGVGSNQFVFQFNVDTAGTASAGTGTGCFSGTSTIHVITHPLLNGDPGAIMFITPKDNNAGSDGPHASGSSFRALYLGTAGSCGGGTGTNKWAIQDVTGNNLANGAKFNIMVIKP